MYKNKDKQREANRQASQRRRDKGMTQGMTNEGMTLMSQVTPEDREQIEKDMCAIGLKPKRTAQGNIRVSKPGDSDYVGVAI